VLDNFQSLAFFLPETILSLAVLGILTIDLIDGKPNLRRSAIAATVSLLLALPFLVSPLLSGGERATTTVGLFGGLLAFDPMATFFKIFFILTALVVGIVAMRAKDALDYDGGGRESAEFYTLVLTTTLGMCLMASSTDLLSAFLSLEMVSIMSYILSGFRRQSRQSSEASLKYVIYGGVASGVMLYGMSLLYGLAGATSFAAVRAAVAATPATGTVILAVVLCLAGFGYKIASVPFHMWCPDVYQGAPTPVTAFLSVGPKAAGFALLIRFFSGALPNEIGSGLASTTPWPMLIGIIAMATMTLGNFTALVQTNLKRLFAYSSIAHAGYLLLGLCAGGDDGNRAILIYLVTYFFMNLGAFTVIMAISDAGLGEDLSDYRGLGRRAPLAAVTMVIFLCSLTGLPPFAGFFGKVYLFYALVAKGGAWLVTLALVGLINSAISLYYYARVFKAMYFEEPAVETPLALPRVHVATMVLMALPTAALFIAWSPLVRLVNASLYQWLPMQSAQLPAVTALFP
jgi:NADH-quinone oxidoreductase subunit N